MYVCESLLMNSQRSIIDGGGGGDQPYPVDPMHFCNSQR